MSQLGRALVLAVGLTALAATPTFAQCYNPNDGAWYGNAANYTDGIKAKIGFEAEGVSGNRAIVHPMQFAVSNDNWVGWGTVKGQGVTNTNCPDDYTNWNTYIDGHAYGDYFCDQESTWPSFKWNDDGVVFKLSRGVCSASGEPGNKIMNAFIDGNRITCVDIGGNAASDGVAFGGEAIGYTNAAGIDVQYYSIQRRQSYDGAWVNMGSNATTCADTGYRIRKLSNTNVYAERS